MGIIPIETIAEKRDERFVGNCIIESSLPLSKKTIVGFENHSGQTFFLDKDSRKHLGKIIYGKGNNIHDNTEGYIYKNLIGTYLHGPILPKNPHLTDYIIEKALEAKYKKKIKLDLLDDVLEWQAHQIILDRYI